MNSLLNVVVVIMYTVHYHTVYVHSVCTYCVQCTQYVHYQLSNKNLSNCIWFGHFVHVLSSPLTLILTVTYDQSLTAQALYMPLLHTTPAYAWQHSMVILRKKVALSGLSMGFSHMSQHCGLHMQDFRVSFMFYHREAQITNRQVGWRLYPHCTEYP